MKKARAALFSFTFILALAPAFSSAAEEAVLKFDPALGKTEFLAVGRPSAIKIRGEGPGPQGEIHLASGVGKGKFTMDLTALNTGIDLRDHHMKEKYLEVGKDCAKNSILEVSDVRLPDGWKPGADAELPFEGKLTLHCATKPVSGTLHLAKAGDAGVSAKAEFEIKLTDYSIEIPSYLGIKVADAVKVSVETRSAK